MRIALVLTLSGMVGLGCMPEAPDLGQADGGAVTPFGENPRQQSTPSPSPTAQPVVADAAPPDAPPPPPCMPVNGNTVARGPNGHCYMFFERGKQWEDASNACRAMSQDAHLATLTSAAENDLVTALLSGQEAWIGFEDMTLEGSFRWVTGELVNYTNFADGEPNDGGGNEDCAITNKIESETSGQWDDRNCGLPYGYVCERDR